MSAHTNHLAHVAHTSATHHLAHAKHTNTRHFVGTRQTIPTRGS
jgi:hypothetical protein